jgi:hypothetical protein
MNRRELSVSQRSPLFARLSVAAALSFAALMPAAVKAQVVVSCDFDIADDLGRYMFGNTIHLEAQRGVGTDAGSFYLINGNSPETDVDHDGYATNCNYNDLYVAARTNLVNTANQALAIPGENITISNMPRTLLTGQRAEVFLSVQVPRGTVAGTYIGQVEIRDNRIFAAFSPTREPLNVDVIQVQVRVFEDLSVAIVSADSAALLDSLVIRGRSGQRASGALRLANAGNANLNDVRITATDLRSESAVGLFIPAENVTFSPTSLAGLQVNDTTRVIVTVQIPRGILGGRYRGTLRVQSAGTAPQQIPLIVIVTSTRGILFGNNPVREINGDIANIAFNGDPGTAWKLAIYDMAGLVTYKTSGTVFAGSPSGGGTALVGADFAVNAIWPLRNGRGESVASGMYLVVVESIVSGKRQLAQDKLMVIR